MDHPTREYGAWGGGTAAQQQRGAPWGSGGALPTAARTLAATKAENHKPEVGVLWRLQGPSRVAGPIAQSQLPDRCSCFSP